MGKSPGKWIKSVLFGKKPTKHQLSKKREKFPNEREVVVAAKASGADYVSVPPIAFQGNEGILEMESKQVGDSHVDDEIHLEGNHNVETQGSLPQDALADPEQIKKEQAATALQATFRGYLARRAFWALKGIIRLQALIRGHLVRRQAVATLCSLLGIVKFQAIIRGKRVRDSAIGIEVQSKCSLVLSQEGKNTDPVDISTQMSKLSTNAFIRKLLAPSPNATPLYVHYESGEPNSVASWLERWSSTCFWTPVALLKKNPEVKSQKKHATNGHASESHANRSKRTRRPTSNNSETAPTSEFERPKRTFRKVSSHPPAEPVPENPQVDLEKVKRNLRKVHNPVVENSGPSEAEVDPKRSLEKEKITGSAPDGTDQLVGHVVEKAKKETAVSEKVKKDVTNPSEKMKKESMASEMSKREVPSTEKAKKDVTLNEKVKKEPIIPEMAKRETVSNEKVMKEPVPLLSEVEPVPEPLTITKEIADLSLCDQPAADEPPIESLDNGNILPDEQVNIESLVLTGKEENVSETKEDLAATENGKSGRKAFTPAKPERAENGLQTSPVLPSYMAATESAKAKLRAQGASPKPVPEVIDKNSLNRRHSLPSSTNGKVSSQSPRTQRPTAQSGGKSGNKVDRALTSRDGSGKAAQAEWRR